MTPLEFHSDLVTGSSIVLENPVTVELVAVIVGRYVRAADETL